MIKMNPYSLTSGKQENFAAIDIVKFICAILVVMVHVAPMGTNHSAVNDTINFIGRSYISKLAVPFFFMCTGFLLFRRSNREDFSIRKNIGYVFKTWRLHLIWTLIYLVFTILEMRSSGYSLVQNLAYFVRNCIFVGGFPHLWYLNATAFAVLLVSLLLHKKLSLEKIFGGAFVCYLIGLLGQSWFGLIRPLEQFPFIWNALKTVQLVISSTRNGLFFGFVFVSMGMLFAYRPIRMSTGHAITGFCVSMALLLVEILALERIGWPIRGDMYLCMVPACYYLFYIVSHIELKGGHTCYYLRVSSSLIYFVHMWMLEFAYRAFGFLGIDAASNSLMFLTVLAMSIIASIVIIQLAQCRRFKWLKKLYS